MSRFVILRDTNTPFRGGRPFPGPMTEGLSPAARGDALTPPDGRVEIADLPAREAREIAREADVEAVARVMPTRLIAPVGEGAAPASTGAPTWGVTAVGADTSPFDGAGVTCAVLDTGIDATHPAFTGVTLTQRDFSGDGDGDGNGHGTHCAGTVFGRDVEGTRIGVAPGVTNALIGKVLGNSGGGSSEMLFSGMQWAFDAGAKVMSMSLGFDFPGFAKQLIEVNGLPADLATSIALEAYRENLRVFDRIMDMFRARAAFNGGCVVVAATGNESQRDIDPDHEVSASVPSAAEGVIRVGALGQASGGLLSVASFSNTNPIVSAPGVAVVSAQLGGGLVAFNGTSMATPHVAGLAALWWQALAAAPVPLSSMGVEARLLSSARTDVFTAGTDISDRGHGLAQAPAAAIS
ncbi:S8 family serine peptidase [Rhodobacterales bacterium HKCCE2091]|nr:S8 family serine peptidase [Rhodobacterales bacterium HKCCE2091]